MNRTILLPENAVRCLRAGMHDVADNGLARLGLRPAEEKEAHEVLHSFAALMLLLLFGCWGGLSS